MIVVCLGRRWVAFFVGGDGRVKDQGFQSYCQSFLRNGAWKTTDNFSMSALCYLKPIISFTI